MSWLLAKQYTTTPEVSLGSLILPDAVTFVAEGDIEMGAPVFMTGHVWDAAMVSHYGKTTKQFGVRMVDSTMTALEISRLLQQFIGIATIASDPGNRQRGTLDAFEIGTTTTGSGVLKATATSYNPGNNVSIARVNEVVMVQPEIAYYTGDLVCASTNPAKAGMVEPIYEYTALTACDLSAVEEISDNIGLYLAANKDATDAYDATAPLIPSTALASITTVGETTINVSAVGDATDSVAYMNFADNVAAFRPELLNPGRGILGRMLTSGSAEEYGWMKVL